MIFYFTSSSGSRQIKKKKKKKDIDITWIQTFPQSPQNPHRN